MVHTILCRKLTIVHYVRPHKKKWGELSCSCRISCSCSTITLTQAGLKTMECYTLLVTIVTMYKTWRIKFYISDTTPTSRIVLVSEILAILTIYMMLNISYLSLPRRSRSVRRAEVVGGRVTCMYYQQWYTWLFMSLTRKCWIIYMENYCQNRRLK